MSKDLSYARIFSSVCRGTRTSSLSTQTSLRFCSPRTPITGVHKKTKLSKRFNSTTQEFTTTNLVSKEKAILRTDRKLCSSAKPPPSETPKQESFTNLPLSNQTSAASASTTREFWKRWLAEKPMPDRWTYAWWWEMAIIFTVFGITGSSSMFLVRPLMKKGLGLEGSMKEGPWSYRFLSLGVLMPIYSITLVCVGTIFGRHAYFKKFALRMWRRFIPSRFLPK